MPNPRRGRARARLIPVRGRARVRLIPVRGRAGFGSPHPRPRSRPADTGAARASPTRWSSPSRPRPPVVEPVETPTPARSGAESRVPGIQKDAVHRRAGFGSPRPRRRSRPAKTGAARAAPPRLSPLRDPAPGGQAPRDPAPPHSGGRVCRDPGSLGGRAHRDPVDRWSSLSRPGYRTHQRDSTKQSVRNSRLCVRFGVHWWHGRSLGSAVNSRPGRGGNPASVRSEPAPYRVLSQPVEPRPDRPRPDRPRPDRPRPDRPCPDRRGRVVAGAGGCPGS